MGLIVHKAFAARDKDWLDIRGIVTRQKSKKQKLDAELIWSELNPLLEMKEDASARERLHQILDDLID